jgi:hypothetical protein
MRRIAILNGPPGSGKDTLAAAIAADKGVQILKFAEPLKHSAARLSGVPYFTDERWLRLWKDLPSTALFGATPRQYLIQLSEGFFKPLFGANFFGNQAKVRVNSAFEFGLSVVFSDGGFLDEIVPLVVEFGAENVAICHLHRDGCSFRGDSRDYVKPPAGCMHFYVHNEGRVLSDLAESAVQIRDWLLTPPTAR